MFPKKKWKILNTDYTRSIVDVLLENRDLPPEHMDSFKLSDRMHSPYLLPDMEKGVNRVLEAVRNGEKICIFGDYDVDGVTSTAVMINFFRRINFAVNWKLPHREKDGYGLRIESVDQIIANDVNLIITVDNGITSEEAVSYAKTKGLDVVVTDHHLQEGGLPEDAVAVINPNRTDSEYPFKSICGAVVAFKFVYALSEKLLDEGDFKQFLLDQLDLVCIGTIADVMPLRDENYALVKFGLKVLTRTKRPGLIALKKVAGVNQKAVTPITVGFFLGPRLNAAGRIEKADTSLKLLIAESHEEAQLIANRLNDLNKKRQQLQAEYLKEAQEQLPGDGMPSDKAIIVENNNWPAGLIGLISGQLKERYARPAIAFTQNDDGNFVGSARSIDEFHITNALTRFNQYFVNYGGHHKAAGLTVHKDKYEIFKNEFRIFVNKALQNDQLTPELIIDSVIDINHITLNNTRIIQEIGPFGETNPEPLFLLEKATIQEIMVLSKGKHLKMYVKKGNQIYEAIWWNAGEYKDKINFSETMDIVFKLNINIWGGTDRLQLTVEDIAIHQA